MSQYAYILVVISLLFLFLVNKYEKKVKTLPEPTIERSSTFRATIKENQTIENINDVIDYINKGYRLEFPFQRKLLTKFAITNRDAFLRSLLFLTTKISTR